MRLLCAIVLPFALLLAAPAAPAQVAVPELKARVTDLTGTLAEAQRAALEQRLAAFEAARGVQVAVLLVPTTQPEPIEQYSMRVAERWRIGRKGVDDGVLLLVAMKDRAVRLEVGYGLEGALPDARARRIIDEHMLPRFRQGDYFGALDTGASRIMAALEGEPLPAPATRTPPPDAGWQGLIVMGLVLLFVVGGLVRALFGRFVGSVALGSVGGIIAWILVGSLAAALLMTLFVFVLSLMGGAGGGPAGGWRRRGGYGGWHAGRRGGWSGGGGFGGGGWGGGGGGFGGGGASGRW